MSTSPVAVSFAVVSQPSRSKGWGRYRAPGVGVQSDTGNQWVSADHGGTADAGATFLCDLDVEVACGKGKRRETETFSLVAEEGATALLRNIPGSQGMTVRVTGARIA